MLLRCNCKHKYQQEKYGDKRVHNQVNGKTDTYRCTVCDTERTRS